MWALVFLIILVAIIWLFWSIFKTLLLMAVSIIVLVVTMGILYIFMHSIGLSENSATAATCFAFVTLLAALGLWVKSQENSVKAKSTTADATTVSYMQTSPLHGEPFEPAADVMNWRESIFYFSYDEIHNCLMFVKGQNHALHEGQRLVGYYINVNGNYAKEGDILANVTAEPLVFNSLGKPVRTPLDKYRDDELSPLTLSVYFVDVIPGATTGQPCKEEINFLEPDKPGAMPNYSTPRKDMLESITLLHHIMVRNAHLDENLC